MPYESDRISLLKILKKHAICAEIGVWKGDFSHQIILHTMPTKLHLIDPWLFQGQYPDRMYGGKVAANQHDMDNIYGEVQNRFVTDSCVVINKGTSSNVLETLPDAYLDWVYIDGNHYYEYVLSDLELCLHKVKPIGVITGDDYHWGAEYGYPVKNAVTDFLAKHSLQSRLSLIGSQYLIRLSSVQ